MYEMLTTAQPVLYAFLIIAIVILAIRVGKGL